MRHRGEAGAAKSVVNGVTNTFTRLSDLLSEDPDTGRHKAPNGQPLIPTQKVPTHETMEPVEQVEMLAATDTVEVTAPEVLTEDVPEAAVEPAPEDSPIAPTASVPTRAQWKASHAPRVFAAALLLFAVAGTFALGLQYAQTRKADEFVSVVIGVGVVVGLWALLIASTPQVVSLRGSVLTVRNSSGSERFDLADGLQPVDVVGEPRSSQWALLLHRSNNTSVVLRRRDVDAVALDPIVRHYRAMADQRYSDRQVRFSR
jgi:uncharacterized integral membrane protein